MARIKLPAYLKWRNGRPRWEPGPKLRGAGWRGQDLKDEAGQWLGIEAAIAAAVARNGEVATSKPARRRQPRAGARTVGMLVREWERSPRLARKAASTRRDYKLKADVFLAEFGAEAVAALEKADLYAWWERLYKDRGHAMANGVLAVARLILSYGEIKGWRRDNPARQLQLETVPPRVVVWSDSEVADAVAAADAMRLAALADAIVLALHTGQRQGDVLRFEDAQISHGRISIRQGKRNARVSVPFTDQLAARIEAIRARRAGLPGVVDLTVARRLVLRPGGAPYSGDALRKDFARLRDDVATRHPEFSGKTFADLRDTAITRLALAGCTIPEIRAITGHTMATIHGVLEHYLALDDRMSASGIAKLRVWIAEQEVAL